MKASKSSKRDLKLIREPRDPIDYGENRKIKDFVYVHYINKINVR